MIKRIAILTGVTGQDGAYLSRYLLQKNYRVIGLIRSFTGSNLFRLKYLKVIDKIELIECDLQDLSQVIMIISTYKPDEIYNLAAQSSVSLSFKQPIGTIQFNINSVLNILEAIRLVDPNIRFYQASTSEMYGKIESLPITEKSKFHPLSPYAISKVTGHHITINYRESYNLFTSCGILFNHESYLRGENFFVKKLIIGAIDIFHGKKDHLEFGNLEIKRDFGSSQHYVEAMWLMLQYNTAEDFVVCSGQSLRLRDIVEYVFKKLNIPSDKIKINQDLFRPTEIRDIYGSSEKAKRLFNWEYNISFYSILNKLMEEEQTNYEQ
jgi:GDPmannose 4,6-dehydratase